MPKSPEKPLDPRLLAKLGTLRQMEIFLKVAELNSIARAAEQLFLTQPSVSIQIRKLSEAIGLPLYEVIGKQLKLTEAGREVAQAGREIFSVVNRLDDTVNDLKGLKSGTLSISVASTAKYFLPYVLAPFCELYPGVEVELKIGNRADIIERLNANLDDLYFFGDLPKGLEIESFPFLPNPIAVMASKNHHLAGDALAAKTFSWKDLENERFVMREPGSSPSHFVQKYLKANKLVMRDVMTIQSNEAIKHAVMANMGISIISAYILSNADTDGLIQLNVEGFPLLSEWRIVHLKDKKLSSITQRFLEFMLENSRDLLPMKKIERNVQRAMDGTWGAQKT